MQNLSSWPTSKTAQEAILDDLRQRVRQIERGSSQQRSTAHHQADLDLGYAPIDRRLGPHGLARGRVHEIIGEGWSTVRDGATFGFTAALIARLQSRFPQGQVLWCGRATGLYGGRPYGRGLAQLGVDPGRLLWLDGGSQDDRLWAFEEGLRTPGLLAAVLEAPPSKRRAGGVDTTIARRLQLAAEAGASHGFVIRPEDNGVSLNGLVESRWRVRAAAGPRHNWWPSWQLELLRARSQQLGQWQVTWNPQARCLNSTATLTAETPHHIPQANTRRSAGNGRVAA
jgi:protein ImuA